MNDIKIRALIDHMCYLHSTNPNCKLHEKIDLDIKKVQRNMSDIFFFKEEI